MFWRVLLSLRHQLNLQTPTTLFHFSIGKLPQFDNKPLYLYAQKNLLWQFVLQQIHILQLSLPGKSDSRSDYHILVNATLIIRTWADQLTFHVLKWAEHIGHFLCSPCKFFTGNHAFYSSEQKLDYWLATQLLHVTLVGVLHARLRVDKVL